LCGQKIDRPCGSDRFVYGDEDNRPHFYRLIRIERDDKSAVATFFHYFGNDCRFANKAHPRMIPPDRLFKKRKTT